MSVKINIALDPGDCISEVIEPKRVKHPIKHYIGFDPDQADTIELRPEERDAEFLALGINTKHL